ncbi:ABC transporter substrate-binding protein [Klenkia taihuensis]|uniref:Polar amino acid transport system substrate-binding protein n=1 Tax=Klenkia taihuensis TaxID=1225127 RepID=A0A1I1SS89_9ACTN|nr:ABC transporter substrate-binding protein [Klenkia taihuensis]GHE13376.1 amino acid ABC transporter substrate-binding protein [Klenkia taihuensis]SFD46773.1 polar amino acid transport system substrate-binding protein [Klenkia taihuensis]
MRRRPLALAVLATAALAVSACAPQESSTGSAASGSSGGGSCTPEDLPTVASDTLTIATDTPAYEPWFVDDDPTNGEGYESAVAYAVAEQLGYDRDQVEWTSVQFNAAITPGDKDFDLDINQFTITDERRQAVDFSSPYYTATQAVITTEGSPAAGATSVADLKGLRIGAQVATTSLTALTDEIAPDAGPVVFNTNDDAKLALQNGQVDAIVVDLPTAFYITSAELEDGVIVGQLEGSSGGDEYGLLLAKDSPLTDCVTQAVDALDADGTLAALQEQWLSEAADAPVLS